LCVGGAPCGVWGRGPPKSTHPPGGGGGGDLKSSLRQCIFFFFGVRCIEYVLLTNIMIIYPLRTLFFMFTGRIFYFLIAHDTLNIEFNFNLYHIFETLFHKLSLGQGKTTEYIIHGPLRKNIHP
jgi:hypothetical protein